MNRNSLFVGIAIFLFVTVFVMSLEVADTSRQVKISNQDVALSTKTTEIIDNDVKLKGQGVKVNTSGKFSTEKVKLSSSNLEYNTQPSKINKQSSSIKYKNLDTSEVDLTLDNIKNNRLTTQKPRERRYMYKDIDWNTWKSNFVNKILEDSLNIRELDNYNEGDFLTYSFNVSNTGEITNISVKSFALSSADKQKVAQLIKSYEYKDITLFPQNTKKKSASVFAMMVLSNTTQKSRPEDFSEHERVRIEY